MKGFTGSGGVLRAAAAGVPARGICAFPAADNAFWDFHGNGPLGTTYYKAGLGAKTVKCRQVYKCKNTNLTPSFKVTRTFSNVTVNGIRRNQIDVAKAAE